MVAGHLGERAEIRRIDIALVIAVVQAGRHRRARLRDDRAPPVFADSRQQVRLPLRLRRVVGPESVEVEREQRAIQLRGRTDSGDVVVVARAGYDHALARYLVVVVEPARGDRHPLVEGVAERLVHDLEVDVGVLAVLRDDGVPHGVEGGLAVYSAVLRVVGLPVAEDDFEPVSGGGVDGALVGIPPVGPDTRGIDGQANGVGLELVPELQHDVRCLRIGRAVVVRGAQPDGTTSSSA